ncbi:MAG: hypothetical protein RMI53_06320 [Nitrososphaerota archaeon]|nr:hypothetical protein [Nitrososphaerota archaeon]
MPFSQELYKIFSILLVEHGSYTYIDKLAQSTSKDIALYHIREALRDYHSLINRGINYEEAKTVANSIDFLRLENEIKEIGELSSLPSLRERVSLLSSQALAEAARIKSRVTYNIGKKIKDFLYEKGLKPEDIENFRKAIKDNLEKISESLGIDESTINEIADNTSLLRHLIDKKEE